jgi:hypothetical protein
LIKKIEIFIIKIARTQVRFKKKIKNRRNKMAGLVNKKHLKLRTLIILMTIGLLFSMTFLIADLKGEEATRDSGATQKEKPQLNIFNLYNRALGSVDIEGNVTNQYGRFIGSVDSSGVILNVSKIVIGQVTPEGNVLNQSGTILGSVSKDGAICNVSGRKVGEVRDVEDINLIGGAARLLFLGVSHSK